MEPFFREEATESRKLSWLGRPQLTQPAPSLMISIMLIACMLGIVLLVGFGRYTKRTTLPGEVGSSEGIVRAHAPTAGRMVMQKYKEGQEIFPGETLFKVDVSSNSETVQKNLATLEKLREQRTQLLLQIDAEAALSAIEASGIEKAYKSRSAAISHIEKRILESSIRLRQLKLAVQERKENFAKRVATRAELDSSLSNFAAENRHHDGLVLDLISWREELLGASNARERNEHALEVVQTELRLRLADIDSKIQETRSSSTIEVLASARGRVSGVQAKNGQTVLADTPVMSIVPVAGDIEIHILASDRVIPHVNLGDEVGLKYRAFPYQRFGRQTGEVQSISEAPVASNNLSNPTNSSVVTNRSANNLYKIVIAPKLSTLTRGKERYDVQVGMSVAVEFTLEERSIYQWIFNSAL